MSNTTKNKPKEKEEEQLQVLSEDGMPGEFGIVKPEIKR